MLKNISQFFKSEKLPPVLLMYGEEDFLLDQAYDTLISKLCPDEVSRYDADFVDADEKSINEVIIAAESFPFTSSKRVVVVKNFHKYFSGVVSKKKQESSPLNSYLKSPSETTVLILKASVEKLKGLSVSLNNPSKKSQAEKTIKNAKFPYGEILREYEWIEFPKVYESDFPRWAIAKIKKAGKEISSEAAQLLTAHVNPVLRELNNEVDKLLLFCKDKDEITVDDINELVGSSRKHNVFELQKSIGQRNLPKSLDILENMLSTDRQEMLILTMLTRYFTTLWKLIEASYNESNQYKIAGAVRVAPFFVPEYLAALRKYRYDEIDNAFFALAEADETLKTTSTDSIYVMQKMLIKIMDR
ncbi:MAG: DNA polymerase III subunit delta [Candidatus Kapabacteria bacterium]|jgi:DNA polymerase-3 subunit delta|nr:DNA polymerase III subunit delta [Candidatus Kapabacteria bacterium]